MAVQAVAATGNGRLAQLVRALPSHGRGQRFKSFVAHHYSPILPHRRATGSIRSIFVLNLLFSSRQNRGLQTFQASYGDCDAVAGTSAVLYSAAMMNLLRTI